MLTGGHLYLIVGEAIRLFYPDMVRPGKTGPINKIVNQIS